MAHLVPIARHFGYTPLLFSYRANRGTIEDHARALCHFLASNGVTPPDTLCILAHSLGGIITLEASSLPQWPFPGARLVMLGSPNQGSRAAQIACRIPLARRQLGSPLEELAQGTERMNHQLEVGVIAARLSSRVSLVPWHREPNDMLVTVSEANLSSARDEFVGFSPHAVMMYRPLFVSEAFYFFDHGHFKSGAGSRGLSR